MTLREKCIKLAGGASGFFTEQESDRLLAALDVAEAVEWIEENEASAQRHDGYGSHGPSWTVYGKRAQGVGRYHRTRPFNAKTLSEAVRQTRDAMESIKAGDARGGEE